MKKVYFITMSLVFYERADKNGNLATFAKARTQRVFCAVKTHPTLGEGVSPPARAAKRSSSSFAVRDSRRLEKRASSRSSRLNLNLAFRTPPLKKRGSSHPHEGHRTMTPVAGPGTAREGESANSRGEGADGKRRL